MNRILATVLLTVALSGHADNGDRSVITIRHMPANPERVIQAFVNREDLESWWKVTRSLVEPEPGGVWSIAWDDWGETQTHHAWSGVIREISADKLVIGAMVMNEPDLPLLGPMQLEVTAEPAEGGCTVTVTHMGYGYGEHWDKMYELVVVGWDHVLDDMHAWFDADY